MTGKFSHQRTMLAAIEAVSLASPDRLHWCGERVKTSTAGDSESRLVLLDQLLMVLYRQFYCYGRVVPLPQQDSGSRMALATADFKSQLAGANRSSDRWERGWRITSENGERIEVEQNGLRMLLVNKNAWRPGRADGYADVRWPSASLAASPGFCLITSDLPFEDANQVRLYWNATPAGAVQLMQAATTLLGEERVPYRLKVLTDLSDRDRADSSVLYIQQKDFQKISSSIRQIHAAVRDELLPNVPAFTLRIGPGLGLAEQPPQGESFGRHRCALLAAGLLKAAEAGLRDKERVQCVIDRFVEHGIALEAPHLNPGSTADYSLRLDASRLRPVAARSEVRPEAFLDTATRIGAVLVKTALWSEDSCNWMGERMRPVRCYGALGPELYSGTSGIAWFLAELYRASGKREFRNTALAAIQRACGAVESAPASYGHGLYDGMAGVAYAAWRCSRLLNRPDLEARSKQLLRRIPQTKSSAAGDVVSGDAGAILTAAALGDSNWLSEACGRSLLATAKRRQDVWSWRTINPARSPHLTGFAHGTAGIAAALLVLYSQTGDSEYRDAAEGAIRYEQSCFNPSEQNWPDYRGARNRRSSPAFTTAWCHGAPGIALCRALAISILGSSELFQFDLSSALATTRAAVTDHLGSNRDFCLCHGLAGNADILHLVGDESDRSRIGDVARHGQSEYGNGEPAARAIAGKKAPGLMTGLAGIGHFYLRLFDPEIPSPLWIGPALKTTSRAA